MKPICYNPDGTEVPLTSGQRRRNERARIHQINKEKGYRGQYVPCYECGGNMSWCSCCEMYTRTCCVDYGTCMCS